MTNRLSHTNFVSRFGISLPSAFVNLDLPAQLNHFTSPGCLVDTATTGEVAFNPKSLVTYGPTVCLLCDVSPVVGQEMGMATVRSDSVA